MPCSSTNQVLVQMALWQTPQKFPLGVHASPKELDKEVAHTHLDTFEIDDSHTCSIQLSQYKL
ncbi:hypothetical protein Clacol_004551 [Clathrus columnatus]|uniref:Uncharacterized protein n=1 Tax=Clathrus columnatus TaxID=1419009 RepID=A0AAV5ABN3_9AGAM|nr:hypothetical protein Clacol_004551 [Clathrus columnatus]